MGRWAKERRGTGHWAPKYFFVLFDFFKDHDKQKNMLETTRSDGLDFSQDDKQLEGPDD